MPQRRNTTAAATVREEHLKDYLQDIGDFRRGRIIRKGREVKNDIVYVEKGQDGFLSDRVRIRPTSVNVGVGVGVVQSCSQLQKLGRRIWVAKEILMCSGQMNCERECGGMGRCRDDCLKKDEKRAKSGHRCSFRVNMRMYLHNIGNWEVDVTGRHVPLTVNWVPPNKNLGNKIKTDPAKRKDDSRPSQFSATIVAASKAINQIDAVTDRDKGYIDKGPLDRVGWSYHPANNNINNNNNNHNNNHNNNRSFSSMYGSASIIAVPNLNHQIHQIEDQALDLTQNHRNLNFTSSDNGSAKESLRHIIPRDEFFGNSKFPVTVIPKVEQTETSNENCSKTSNDILAFVKDAVKLSGDNVEAFVIVSATPNEFSYWGTSQFIDKFESSDPLMPYDPAKCHNSLESKQSLSATTTTATPITTTTTRESTLNKTNLSHSTTSQHGRERQQYSGKNHQNCLKIPSPYSFKHSAFYLANLLHKRSATAGNTVVQVPGFKATGNSAKHKTKALKRRKSPIQDRNVDNNRERITTKYNGDDDFLDSRNIDSDEDEAPKENVVVSLMQKERSQALLRILKSRKSNKAGKNVKFGANVQNGLTRDANPGKIPNVSLVEQIPHHADVCSDVVC